MIYATFTSQKNLRKITPMFIGKIEAKRDAKGRVFLPATFRRQLSADDADTVVLRKDPNLPCIILYPMEVFSRKAEQMMEKLDVEWNADDQQLLMEFTAEVEQVALDAQGRLLLNKANLEYMHADTTLLFVGMVDRIAIWDADTFASQRLDSNTFAQVLKEKMGRKNND